MSNALPFEMRAAFFAILAVLMAAGVTTFVVRAREAEPVDCVEWCETIDAEAIEIERDPDGRLTCHCAFGGFD